MRRGGERNGLRPETTHRTFYTAPEDLLSAFGGITRVCGSSMEQMKRRISCDKVAVSEGCVKSQIIRSGQRTKPYPETCQKVGGGKASEHENNQAHYTTEDDGGLG